MYAPMSTALLFGLALVLAFLLTFSSPAFMRGRPISSATPRRRCILTYTTFFDFEKQDKYEAFTKSIESILTSHSAAELALIETIVVINEYYPVPKKDWTKLVNDRWPAIHFIQKSSPSQKSQMKSLNLILRQIAEYDYWFHIEESWYCTRPFIAEAIEQMELFPDISQLQMNANQQGRPHWSDIDPKQIQCVNDKICRVHPPSPEVVHKIKTMSVTDIEGSDINALVQLWPLYSLQPSVNRVEHYKGMYFLTYPSLFPVKFEFEFGARWLLFNKKAYMVHSPFKRDDSHISTYTANQ